MMLPLGSWSAVFEEEYNMAVNKDFVGNGFSWPMRVDARGRVALSSGERDVEEAIRLIILTPCGTRWMRPTFGCHIHDIIFHPGNTSTYSLAARYVEDALRLWEPRIDPLSIEVTQPDDARDRLRIHIEYRVKSTYDRRTLVFPFYVIPFEE